MFHPTRIMLARILVIPAFFAASTGDADAAPPAKRLTLKAVGMQVRSADPAWSVRTELVDGQPGRDILTHATSTLTITLTPLTGECEAALGAFAAKDPRRARWSRASPAMQTGPLGWHPAYVSFTWVKDGDPAAMYCVVAQGERPGMTAAINTIGEWRMRAEWVLEDLLDPAVPLRSPTDPRPRPPRPEPAPEAVRAELEGLVEGVSKLSEGDPSATWVDLLERLLGSLPFGPTAAISAEDLKRYRETLQDAAARFFRHTDIHASSSRVLFVWRHNGLRLGVRTARDVLTWPVVRVFAGALDENGDRMLDELGLPAEQLAGVDANGDGRLSLDEAVDAVEHGKLSLTLDANRAGAALFALDSEGDGYIGIHELDLPYKVMRAADEMEMRGLKVKPGATFEIEVGKVARDGRVAIIELAAMFGQRLVKVGRTLELDEARLQSAPAR